MVNADTPLELNTKLILMFGAHFNNYFLDKSAGSTWHWVGMIRNKMKILIQLLRGDDGINSTVFFSLPQWAGSYKLTYIGIVDLSNLRLERESQWSAEGGEFTLTMKNGSIKFFEMIFFIIIFGVPRINH